MSAVFNNATLSGLVQASTYSQTLQNVAHYQPQLNFMEKYWAAWYSYMNNDVLATGLMFFYCMNLCISLDVCHGSSSTKFHTLEDGSYNQLRFQVLRNNYTV